MFKSLMIASLLVSSAPAFSEETDPAHTITSVEIKQVATPVATLSDLMSESVNVELPKIPTNPVDEIAMYIDGLIAIGKKIWPIIEAGKPVITTGGIIPSLSVLPHIEGNPVKAELNQMAGWSIPKAISYRIAYKNYFGSEVVAFTYTIYYQYGGSYKGVGKYITNLKVQASSIRASWGFNFDAKSELTGVSNVGTEDAPVASAIIEISYSAKGLNEGRTSHSIYVDGNGVMKSLNY